MASPSTKRLLHLLFVGALTVVSVIPKEINAMTFTRCSEDIEDYFQSLFPEWSPTQTPAPPGRLRRRLEGETNQTGMYDPMSAHMESRFRKSPRPPKVIPSGDSAESPKETQSMDDPVNLKTSSLLDEVFASHDEFRAPPNAYMAARAAAAGCFNCLAGCCDGTDIELTCAKVDTPYTYMPSESAATFQASIYRVRISNAYVIPIASEAKNLWLLQGGPGGSGLSILSLAVHSLQFATDIYIPDHRGTGRSGPITCPQQTSSDSASGEGLAAFEIPGCALYSENSYPSQPFNIYTVTNAARDLARWILDVKSDTPLAQNFIHAYSYGTRWASRLLVLYPDIVDKVILEGNVNNETYFDDFAKGANAAGLVFLQKCALDSECYYHFPGLTFLNTYVDKLVTDGHNNPCTTFLLGSETLITKEMILVGIQYILNKGLILGMEGPYPSDVNKPNDNDVYIDFRTFALATFIRWRQCTYASVERKDRGKSHYHVFVAGFTWLLSLNGGFAASAVSNKPDLSVSSAELQNEILYHIVAQGELRKYPYPYPSAIEFNIDNADIHWANPSTYTQESEWSQAWESSEYRAFDEFTGTIPTSIEAEVLVLNGEIDGQTTHLSARQQYNEINGVSIKLAVVPDAGHHASFGLCGLTIAKSFFNGGYSSSCAIATENAPDQILPLVQLVTNFEISARYAHTLLGLSTSKVFQGYATENFCTWYEFVKRTPSQCIRCFDYCLFTAEIVKESCQCAEELSTCLYQASDLDRDYANDKCYAYTGAWSEMGASMFAPSTGACALSRSCENNHYGANTDIAIGLIVGSTLGAVFLCVCCLVCFFRMRRSNGEDNGPAGGARSNLPQNLELASAAPVFAIAVPSIVAPATIMVQMTSKEISGLAIDLNDFYRIHDPSKTREDCAELAEWASKNGGVEALNAKLRLRHGVGLDGR